MGAQSAPDGPQGWLGRAAAAVPCLGIGMALCSSLFLGTAAMLVKLVHSVHGIQVAVLRACLQLAVYGAVIGLRRGSWRPAPGETLAVCGRALMGAVSITASYCALRLIPLGDATTIRFSMPVWTLIIGYLALGEQCSLSRLLAVAVSITGVALIAKPDACLRLLELLWQCAWAGGGAPGAPGSPAAPPAAPEAAWGPARPLNQSLAAAEHLLAEPWMSEQLQGCLLALLSSVCLSVSLISMRCSIQTPCEVIVFWLSAASIALGLASLVALDQLQLPDNALDAFYILLNGLVGAAGQWFVTNALKVEQSSVIALVRTFDIQVSFMYSALLLREHIRITSLVGSGLVSVGVLAVLLQKHRTPRRPAPELGADHKEPQTAAKRSSVP